MKKLNFLGTDIFMYEWTQHKSNGDIIEFTNVKWLIDAFKIFDGKTVGIVIKVDGDNKNVPFGYLSIREEEMGIAMDGLYLYGFVAIKQSLQEKQVVIGKQPEWINIIELLKDN